MSALAWTALGSLAVWGWLLLCRGFFWRTDQRLPRPPGPGGEPDEWPDVAVLVPARDEAAVLPLSLPSLLAQEYPGRAGVVLVDDGSTDGTGALARSLSERYGGLPLRVVSPGEPPPGWTGKLWAVRHGIDRARAPHGESATRPETPGTPHGESAAGAAGPRRPVTGAADARNTPGHQRGQEGPDGPAGSGRPGGLPTGGTHRAPSRESAARGTPSREAAGAGDPRTSVIGTVAARDTPPAPGHHREREAPDGPGRSGGRPPTGTHRTPRRESATRPESPGAPAGESAARSPGRPGGPAADGPSRGAAAPEYLLLTDADIAHAPDSLRALVSAARAHRLDLVSQMARLRVTTGWERLVVPAFVYFFCQLYPFRRVNRPGSRTAAAAGGCVLLRTSAADRAGVPDSIRGAVIDDVALARAVRRSGGRIWLGLAERVTSVRPYPGLPELWRMVSRSAYTQLRHSPVLLAGTVAGLILVYLVPPWAVCAGLVAGDTTALRAGACAWALMAMSCLPMLRYYRQPPLLALALPFTALLYLLMTVDSALRHHRGLGASWKGRAYTRTGGGGRTGGSGR